MIAINHYHKKPDDPSDLNTSRDVNCIRDTLTSKKFGFKNEDIIVIDDTKSPPSATTHDGIIAAFRQFIEKTIPGDIVYFHFSGHGSEVADPTNHKLTGVSQTIVPLDFDASIPDPKNEITDLELKALVQSLMDKKPLSATLTFDCCHSGGDTRGRHASRGFEHPGALPRKKVTGVISDKLIASTDSNLVVIAACRPDQKAWETTDETSHDMGLFTYCLTKALQNANDKTTYN
ncbi:MAG: caspase family protein, partial [Terriglobales bacterium]